MAGASSLLRCLTCGYDLRGLPSDGRCPECGRPVGESADPWRRNLPPAVVKRLAVPVAFRLVGPPLCGIAVILLVLAMDDVWAWGLLPMLLSGLFFLATAASRLGFCVAMRRLTSELRGWIFKLDHWLEGSSIFGFAALGVLLVYTALGTYGLVGDTLLVPLLVTAGVGMMLALVAAARRIAEGEVMQILQEAVAAHAGGPSRAHQGFWSQERRGPTRAIFEAGGIGAGALAIVVFGGLGGLWSCCHLPLLGFVAGWCLLGMLAVVQDARLLYMIWHVGRGADG